MRLVRCLEENEWLTLKALRLNALSTDPEAFSETLDEAKAFSDEYWIKVLKNTACFDSSKVFILESGNEILGFVFGIRKNKECRLGGLWIDPVFRKQNLGNLLVQAVKEWSCQFDDSETLKLWVLDGTLVRFYKNCGFELNGNKKEHPVSGAEIVEMVWNRI